MSIEGIWAYYIIIIMTDFLLYRTYFLLTQKSKRLNMSVGEIHNPIKIFYDHTKKKKIENILPHVDMSPQIKAINVLT